MAARVKRPKHTCPVPFCDALVPSPMLMCAPCWRRIPVRDRRSFYKAARGETDEGYWVARARVIQLSAEKR
jgi:hypothetical protein